MSNPAPEILSVTESELSLTMNEFMRKRATDPFSAIFSATPSGNPFVIFGGYEWQIVLSGMAYKIRFCPERYDAFRLHDFVKIVDLLNEDPEHQLDPVDLLHYSALVRAEIPEVGQDDMDRFLTAVSRIPLGWLNYLKHAPRRFVNSPSLKIPKNMWDLNEFVSSGGLFDLTPETFEEETVILEDWLYPVHQLIYSWKKRSYVFNGDGNLVESIGYLACDYPAKPAVLTRRHTFIAPQQSFQYLILDTLRERCELFAKCDRPSLVSAIWEIDRVYGKYTVCDFEKILNFMTDEAKEGEFHIGPPKLDGKEVVPKIPYGLFRGYFLKHKPNSEPEYFYVPPAVDMLPFIEESGRFPTKKEALNMLFK